MLITVLYLVRPVYINVHSPYSTYICNHICGRISGLWYRFKQDTGERMPEFCPDLFRRGTIYPIWMDGTHPTGKGVFI